MYRVAVGIPSATNAPGLAALLPQVFRQSGVEPDVLVVANDPAAEAVGVVWQRRWGTALLGAGDNRGVAASWNAAADWAWSRGHDRVVLLNDDVTLDDPEALLRLCLADALWGGRALLTAGEDGWHAFCLPRRLRDRVGRFDEGFWPAYHEDHDYSYRVRLTQRVGGPPTREIIPSFEELAKIPADVWRVLDAEGAFFELPLRLAVTHAVRGTQTDERWGEWLARTKPYTETRYVAKWGGLPRRETFDTPWGSLSPLPGTREAMAREGVPPTPEGTK